FVISGYLITSLLLREFDASGTISLRRFYFRRTLRIFPAYYTFIGVLLLLSAAGLVGLTRANMGHALTYTTNYFPERSWDIGHTWSLSVEEQFYLLWPATLVLAGRRRGLSIAASLVVLCPLIRLALWQLAPTEQTGVGHRFETVADSIAIGCVLAGT